MKTKYLKVLLNKNVICCVLTAVMLVFFLCVEMFGICGSKPTIKSKSTIVVGKKITVTFDAKGLSKAKVKTCRWSVSNKKILKITTKKTNGKKVVTVKGLKKGKATIKVTCNKKVYKKTITVKNPTPVVTASKTIIDCGTSTTVKFDSKKVSSSKVKKCKWSVSNPNVAVITTSNTKGKKTVNVKGVNAGNTEVKVKCDGKTYKVKITVKAVEKVTESTTEQTTTEQPTTPSNDVDPNSLIGKLEVKSAWYYDPEGKNKVTGTLSLDKDHTNITVYRINTYTVNGNPVPLSKLKEAYLHNAAELYTIETSEQYVTTLCDGKTEHPSSGNDHWERYTYLSQYSTDGKIVYKYFVFNDMDIEGLKTLNFAVYTTRSQNEILGTVRNLGSFKIVPEFRNATVISKDTVQDAENVAGKLEDVLGKTYRKVSTSKTVESLTYTVSHYQICKNAAKGVEYFKSGDYIYTDTSKYNLGIYYRFNDICDNCKQQKICPDATITEVRNLKRNVLETIYFPLSYQAWAGSTKEQLYYKDKECSGYEFIDMTGKEAISRLVYKSPLNDTLYPDGTTKPLYFSTTIY